MSTTGSSPSRKGKPRALGERRQEALRKALEDERGRLREQIARLEADLRNPSWKEPRSEDDAEAGTTTYEREQTQALVTHVTSQLAEIDHALGRMDAGTYGACESCSGPISVARLDARPHAVLCLPCQREAEVTR